jgi:hypothetical protein
MRLLRLFGPTYALGLALQILAALLVAGLVLLLVP